MQPMGVPGPGSALQSRPSATCDLHAGGQVRPPGQGNALQGTPIDGSWLCRMDPWKALDVSWDAADTPMNVPTRVSPWEASP